MFICGSAKVTIKKNGDCEDFFFTVPFFCVAADPGEPAGAGCRIGEKSNGEDGGQVLAVLKAARKTAGSVRLMTNGTKNWTKKRKGMT